MSQAQQTPSEKDGRRLVGSLSPASFLGGAGEEPLAQLPSSQFILGLPQGEESSYGLGSG